VRSIDPGQLGDLSLRGTGIGPKAERIAAERTDYLAVPSLYRAIDTRAALRDWHGAIGRHAAYLALTCASDGRLRATVASLWS